jgi:GNAT superfamily N-acetyltransferase
MNATSFEEQGYSITTDKSKLDIPFIHNYLSEETYWSKNIPGETVEKAIQNSLSFGLFFNKIQIGFARVITDYATFAYLADVFIIPEQRGKKLSKWMIQTIVDHPDLAGLRRWILITRDAHGLYSQFGWKEIAYPDRWMEVHHKDIYQKKE